MVSKTFCFFLFLIGYMTAIAVAQLPGIQPAQAVNESATSPLVETSPEEEQIIREFNEFLGSPVLMVIIKSYVLSGGLGAAMILRIKQ